MRLSSIAEMYSQFSRSDHYSQSNACSKLQINILTIKARMQGFMHLFGNDFDGAPNIERQIDVVGEVEYSVHPEVGLLKLP